MSRVLMRLPMRLFLLLIMLPWVSCRSMSMPTDSKERIVNGLRAIRGQFPYVAGLWESNTRRPFCGATLISPRWLVTAAHCVFGRSPFHLRVALGDLDVLRRDEGEVRRRICHLHIHPFYVTSKSLHDIALLELCSVVPLSATIQPIAISHPGKIREVEECVEGANVTVAGWGSVQEGGPTARQLRYVTLRLQSLSACRSAYPWLTSRQLCAGMEGGGSDSCQGDSGGPLSILDWKEQRRVLIGVVSSGRGCARKNFPGVYTKVADYYKWILSTMANVGL